MKKLGIIIALCVVGVLVVTTIVLSLINKNYAPELANSPTQMIITNTEGKHAWGGNGYPSEAQEENFNKVVQLFESSFKQSILASMLNGNLNNEVAIEYKGTAEPSQTGYKVEFRYASTLLMQNGKAYKLNQNDNEKYFTTVIFFVEEGAGFADFNLFAKVQIDETRTGYYQLTSLANTQALYTFLSELNYQ